MVNSLKDSKSALEKNLEATINKLKVANNQIKSNSDLIEKLSREIRHKSDMINNLKNLIDDLRSKTLTSASKSEKLLQKIDKANGELVNKSIMIENLEFENETLKDSVTNAKMELDSLKRLKFVELN